MSFWKTRCTLLCIGVGSCSQLQVSSTVLSGHSLSIQVGLMGFSFQCFTSVMQIFQGEGSGFSSWYL